MAKRNVTPRAPEVGQTAQLQQIDRSVMPNFVTMPAKSQGQAIAAQLAEVMSALSTTAYNTARLTRKTSKNDIESMKGVIARASYTEAQSMIASFKNNDVSIPGGGEPLTGTSDGRPYSIDNSIANIISGPGGLIEKHKGDASKAITEFVNNEMAVATAGLDPKLADIYYNGYFKDVHSAAMSWQQGQVDIRKEAELNDRVDNVIFGKVEDNSAHWYANGKFKSKEYWDTLREDPKLANMTDAEYEEHLFDIVKTSIEAGKERGLEASWGKGLSVIDGMPGTVDPSKKAELKAELLTARLEHNTQLVISSLGSSMFTGVESPNAPTEVSVYNQLSPSMGDPNDPQVASAISKGLGSWVNVELGRANPNVDKINTRLMLVLNARSEDGKTPLMTAGTASYYEVTRLIGQVNSGSTISTLVTQRNEQKFQAESAMVDWLINGGKITKVDGAEQAYTKGQFQTYLTSTFPLLGNNVIETFLEKRLDKEFMSDSQPDTKIYGGVLRDMMDATSVTKMREIFSDALASNETLAALGKTGIKQLADQLKVAESTEAERHDNTVSIQFNHITAEFMRGTRADASVFVNELMRSSTPMSPDAISAMSKILAQEAKEGANTAIAMMRNKWKREWELWVTTNSDLYKSNRNEYEMMKFQKLNEMITNYGALATEEGNKYRLGEDTQ